MRCSGAVLIALMHAATPAAQAQELQAGPIAIEHAWARPTPGTAVPSAGYMTLTNQGPLDDRLVAATSPVATTVTMHRTEVMDGIARMVPQEDGIAIPAHGSARLVPGGQHLMLSGLKQPLVLGQAVPLTLSFAKAGTVTVDLKVERRPAAAAADHGTHGSQPN